MTSADRPSVLVMGVSGSGKSTVGSLLARRWAVPFADADDFHTAAATAAMAAGRPLTDADRAPWLHRLAGWLAEQPAGCVLACSALKRSYRDLLRTSSPQLRVLHLAGEPTVVGRRVERRPGHYMPAVLVGSQYADLQPLGSDEHGLTVDLSAAPAEIISQFERFLRGPG